VNADDDELAPFGYSVHDGYAEADIWFSPSINDECVITTPDGQTWFVNIRNLAEVVAAAVADSNRISPACARTERVGAVWLHHDLDWTKGNTS
jgi:hypothetical protein